MTMIIVHCMVLILRMLDSSGFSSPPPRRTIAFSPALHIPLSLADLMA